MSGKISLMLLACLVGTMSCGHQPDRETRSVAGRPAPQGSVHVIDLPRYQSNLPAGPGREAFAVACLSCHSTRYITMQPALTAAKWEENVRKMIKTYGAPLAEEQVPQVVQYLMATKEKGLTATWESLASAGVAPADGKLARDSQAPDQNSHRGAALYAQNCSSCHGLRGAGDGISAPTLLPRPTNLTAAHYSPALLATSIRNGVRGTAMPGYAKLNDDELREVVTFTQTLTARPAQVQTTREAAARYATNCVSCHGKDGAGDGFASPPLARPAANFQLKQPTAEEAMRAISDGVSGSAMPAWKVKLSEDQRKQLVAQVRSFYREMGR